MNTASLIYPQPRQINRISLAILQPCDYILNMLDTIDLLLLDFDNVVYPYPLDIHDRGLEAATKVACAYTGLPRGRVQTIISQSWKKHRDAMRNVAALKECKADIHELNRQFASVVDYGPEFGPIDGLNDLLNELVEHTHVAILSHSTTRFVQIKGEELGLPHWLIHRNCYGLDRVEYKRKDMDSGVYVKLCADFGVSANRTMLIEDTAMNLKFAKQAHLQTTHIHWGKQDDSTYSAYIDYSYERTCKALRAIAATNHGVQPPGPIRLTA